MFNPLSMLFDFLGISDVLLFTGLAICLRFLLGRIFNNIPMAGNGKANPGDNDWNVNVTGFFISFLYVIV